jgi:ABC-2 type transport system permease protein
MIARIACKEFLEMARDGRFRLSAGLALLLLVTALALGWYHYRSVRAQQAAAQATDRHQWLAQGERNPHTAAHFGRIAFKPVTPLSFIDHGVNSFLGVAIWMEAHYQDPARFRPAEEATALGRFSALTAASVLQLLVPLLIILLTFSTFAGEREAGTMRLLLSLGANRSKLAAGKALGVAGALALLLAPATLIGALTLMLVANADNIDAGGATVGRFALLALAYLLYFTSLVVLSLAVSATARTGRVALLVLLTFWIVNGLLAPRIVADAAQTLYPTPATDVEFWHAIHKDLKDGIDGHDPSDQRAEALKQRVLAEYGVTKVEDLPVNFSGLALQAGEEYGNEVFDKHYGSLWSAYERQNRFHEFGAIAAPLLAVRSLSMNAAGTDFNHHRHFASQAEAYRRRLNKMLNDDLAYNSHSGQGNYVAGNALWRQATDFVYAAPPASWVWTRGALSLVLLFLWTIGAMSWTWYAVNHLKVE